MTDTTRARPEHYENVKCLSECDEQHAEGCPRFEAEKEILALVFWCRCEVNIMGIQAG